LDWKVFLTVFGTVFLAELGDKTQLATVVFAANKQVNLWIVFVGASLALVLASAIGVLAGGLVADHVSPRHLSYAAGVAFIGIGIWTIVTAGSVS
jgi:putative Ca2+/H+ antiporter (TMEM165/GDT1 family)